MVNKAHLAKEEASGQTHNITVAAKMIKGEEIKLLL